MNEIMSYATSVWISVILFYVIRVAAAQARRGEGFSSFNISAGNLSNDSAQLFNREKRVFSSGSSVQRKYSSWTKWSQCSRRCEQKRFRTCLGTDERECPHGPLHMQSRQCRRCHNNPKSRHSHHQIDDIIGSHSMYEEFFFTSWTRWSHCHKRDCRQYRWKLCAFYPICGERLMVQQRICPERAWHLCLEKPETPAPTATSSNGSKSESDFEDDNIVLDIKSNLTCGISLARSSNVTKKILGGKASAKGKWPFQVIILNHYMENYCAGTLISNWVVTAAHCIRKRMFVKLGEHNIFTDEDTEQLFRPTRVIIHPDFDVNTVENDIALLKIADNIKWGMHVLPACLPDKTDELQLRNRSTHCVVLGWGKRKAMDISGSDVLREANVEVIDQQRCVDAYAGDHTISSRMLCAGGNARTGKGDTCEGDSGGPLLCKTTQESPWKLVGVTSFGDDCGKRDKFGVYTRVTSFLDWITQNTD